MATSHQSIFKPVADAFWLSLCTSGSVGAAFSFMTIAPFRSAGEPPALRLTKQLGDRLALAVLGHEERPVLDFVRQVGRNPERPIERGVEIADRHRLFERREWPFVGGLAVDCALLDAATEQDHAAGAGEVPVHAVELLF